MLTPLDPDAVFFLLLLLLLLTQQRADFFFKLCVRRLHFVGFASLILKVLFQVRDGFVQRFPGISEQVEQFVQAFCHIRVAVLIFDLVD